jgi:hypothetical protein
MTLKIVKDAAGKFYSVADCLNPQLSHAYMGIPMKRVKGKFVPDKGDPRIIRRADTVIVAHQA